MLKLHLLRHGKATEYSSSGNDFDRRLDEFGRDQVKSIAKTMALQQIIIDQIISSKAIRASETAEIINNYCELSEIEFDETLFLAKKEVILSKINSNGKGNNLLYVGHNFGISEIVGYLTGEYLNLSTAMLVQIEFDMDDWKLITKESGRILNTIIP